MVPRLTSLVGAVVLVSTQVLLAQEVAPSKKLIEWGWDEPDTKFMRENVQKWWTNEKLPKTYVEALRNAAAPAK